MTQQRRITGMNTRLETIARLIREVPGHVNGEGIRIDATDLENILGSAFDAGLNVVGDGSEGLARLRGAVVDATAETIGEHGERVRIATAYQESVEVTTVDPDKIADLVASAVDSEVRAVLATEVNLLGNLIAKAAPVGIEMHADGSEDTSTVAYIDGLRTAHDIVKNRYAEIVLSEPTLVPVDPEALPNADDDGHVDRLHDAPVEAVVHTENKNPARRMGRYYVMRKGEWIEALVVEAESPGKAKKIARTIPDEAWRPTRQHYGQIDDKGRDKIHMGNVSLSDDTKAWNV